MGAWARADAWFQAGKGWSPAVSVTLEIPETVCQAVRLLPPELQDRLRLELAAALYAKQVATRCS
jgi:hypothetical protein